jgi:hypothetical protein
MQQQTPGVTVVTAQLAQTDRRALSEAWYRTLHLAAPSGRPRSAPAKAAPSRAEGRGLPAPGLHPRAEASRLGTPTARAARERPVAVEIERRFTTTALARRLERAVVWGIGRPQASACTIRDRGGRILVLVRDDGRQTRIVAVCAPSLRERVERAVAHARFALAAGRARSEVA